MADTHNDLRGSVEGTVIQASTVNLGSSVRAALAGLPPVPSGFTGREQMLAVLRPTDPAPVWVISGLAGVGKTTVVVKATEEAHRRSRRRRPPPSRCTAHGWQTRQPGRKVSDDGDHGQRYFGSDQTIPGQMIAE